MKDRIEELYDLSQYEMVELVLDLEDYIYSLEYEIKQLKKERTEKISKDYQDNKCVIANILVELVK